jgi:hypothetical protein
MSIRNDLTAGPGYSLACRLTAAELTQVRRMITEHYLERLRLLAPEFVETALTIGIENYHTLAIPFDHASSWSKETRLLPKRHLMDFMRMRFYEQIEEEFGPVRISHDELNWRLVRPNQPGDVGPVHLDKWFWDGGYGKMPPGYNRFKIWIPICSEPGANGLRVLPCSHRTGPWQHHFELRDGIRKPILDEDEATLKLELLPLCPGEMVLFHDDLLHGGAVNRGTKCRVSIELTILFRKNRESEPRQAALSGRRAGGEEADG